jgi:hypothetical protein
MTKIITCGELRYRTLAKLEALFRTLQIELGRTKPGSSERTIVTTNVSVHDIGMLSHPGTAASKALFQVKIQKIAVPMALARHEHLPARACVSWPPSRLARRNRQPYRLPPRPCGKG